MEDSYRLYKGKVVAIWLRFGYAFFKKAQVGYDLAKHVEYEFAGILYDPNPPSSRHIHSAGEENRLPVPMFSFGAHGTSLP